MPSRPIEPCSRVPTDLVRGLKAHAPEDTATELRIGLYKVTELVRQYQDSFDGLPFPSESCGPAENWRSLARSFAPTPAGGVSSAICRSRRTFSTLAHV